MIAVLCIPIVFILASGAFVLNTLVERPAESFAGLGFLALGLPVYWYSTRGSRRELRDANER